MLYLRLAFYITALWLNYIAYSYEFIFCTFIDELVTARCSMIICMYEPIFYVLDPKWMELLCFLPNVMYNCVQYSFSRRIIPRKDVILELAFIRMQNSWWNLFVVPHSDQFILFVELYAEHHYCARFWNFYVKFEKQIILPN